jgi:hypothetical protein
VITGDDILIEYVSRVVSVLRLFDNDDLHDEHDLSQHVKDAIQRFISHSVWLKGGCPQPQFSGRKLWARMELRMTEM